MSFIGSVGNYFIYFFVYGIFSYVWYKVLWVCSADKYFWSNAIMWLPLEMLIFFITSILSPVIFIVALNIIFDNKTNNKDFVKIISFVSIMILMLQIYGAFTIGYFKMTKIIAIIVACSAQFMKKKFSN